MPEQPRVFACCDTGGMVIDMGLDDPAAMTALTAAISIVDESVDRLHGEIGHIAYGEDCEVYRLTRALPPGPMSFDRTIIAAAEAARGALDQISDIVRRNSPTSVIVLHALLRAALVGSGRVVHALLPADPSVRLHNARVLVAQEARSFTRALNCYAGFEQLSRLRPTMEYLEAARQQKAALQEGHEAPGDGAVMNGAAEVIGAALASTPEYPNGNKKLLREHVIWLWNTYSGAAHTHAWPRLLPNFSSDRRVPGDYPGDFYMIAVTAHIAMLSFKSRLQSGSANTTEPVALRSEPPESR